jgi:hypothetical protein
VLPQKKVQLADFLDRSMEAGVQDSLAKTGREGQVDVGDQLRAERPASTGNPGHDRINPIG